MNGVLERTLGILEMLSRHGEGLEMATLADQLNIPRSAVHRLLGDLQQFGYVRQTREHGDYVLTTKLVSLGLSFLGNSGISDVAQPLLDRLANVSGELVRLAVVDGNRLTWVARAQGARQGLRYDPDMGSEARLSCSSSGIAWLSALADEEALALVAQQGIGPPEAYGPNAAASLQEVLAQVQAARTRGYSLTEETYTAGLNAMAVPVGLPGEPPLGAITVAGPTVRFTRARMLALAPELLAVAAECAKASLASPFFNHALERPRAAANSVPIYAE
ncbi:IclR family transcriptional regulator [Variovorax sp. HJSM1_2]|uniref:IclR family transcriptional regulator n=1 Tax=Variovorax sp. HJSM1_2 TaxID=3366263 RepID=UPI003BE9597F